MCVSWAHADGIWVTNVFRCRSISTYPNLLRYNSGNACVHQQRHITSSLTREATMRTDPRRRMSPHRRAPTVCSSDEPAARSRRREKQKPGQLPTSPCSPPRDLKIHLNGVPSSRITARHLRSQRCARVRRADHPCVRAGQRPEQMLAGATAIICYVCRLSMVMKDRLKIDVC